MGEREQHRQSYAVLHLVLVVSHVAWEREQHRRPYAVLHLVLVVPDAVRKRDQHRLSLSEQHFVLAVPNDVREREQHRLSCVVLYFVTGADPARQVYNALLTAFVCECYLALPVYLSVILILNGVLNGRLPFVEHNSTLQLPDK